MLIMYLAKEPERFPTAPVDILEKKLNSLPDKGNRYRNAFNSNEQYDVNSDYKRKCEEADGGSLEAVYELAIMYYYGLLMTRVNLSGIMKKPISVLDNM